MADGLDEPDASGSSPNGQPGEVRQFFGTDFIWAPLDRGYHWIERAEWDQRGWLRPLLDQMVVDALATLAEHASIPPALDRRRPGLGAGCPPPSLRTECQPARP